MEKMFLFRIAGKNFHLPKLIGAFIVFFGLLMFFYSIAFLFEALENLRVVKTCVENAGGDPKFLAGCNEIAFTANLGIYVRTQSSLNLRQLAIGFFQPLAWIFWWFAVIVFGFVLYKSGRLSLPIVSETRSLPKRKWKLKQKKSV